MRSMTKLLSPNPQFHSLYRHSGCVYSSFLKTKVPQMSVCCDTDLQCCAHESCLSGPPGAWRRSPGPETRRCRREAARDCAHVSRQRPGLIPPHPWSQTLPPLQPDRGFGVHLQGRGAGEKRKRQFKITHVLSWPCLAPSQIPVASPEKQLIYRRTQNKYFCLTKLVTQEKRTSLGCLLRAELRSVWRGFKLLQSTQADIFIHTVCLHALYLDP